MARAGAPRARAEAAPARPAVRARRRGPPRAKGPVRGATSSELISGGETRARLRLARWYRSGIMRYAERHGATAAEGTSRLSPYLHFGCVSPVEVGSRCRTSAIRAAFPRRLCWRDFHHQVTAAFPAIARTDYRPRGRRWRDDAELLEAWMAGRTGYPIIDARMRQLRAQGSMNNRARLLTASFLMKNLDFERRLGARHFLDLLVDGDVAPNSGIWLWVAGTGTDTRPTRTFNPIRRSRRLAGPAPAHPGHAHDAGGPRDRLPRARPRMDDALAVADRGVRPRHTAFATSGSSAPTNAGIIVIASVTKRAGPRSRTSSSRSLDVRTAAVAAGAIR